ncbi:hypothetical protein N7510_007988 [Penicillium lagena]|uniref:uncharacterized protein n=1 Tax=Penicillium lagena TaxID=94218 RepID=UPI002540A630|nr:uncharacterized protein N7510_007988 [Penicillium lagena]KAJ5611269.1 hypothetical protein N7510_007988 [Penicillium lagena]
MSRQWSLAKNCHTVLSDLQESLGTKKSTAEEFPIGNSTATMRTSLAGPPIGDATNDARPTAKRRRLDGTSLRDFSSSVEAPEDPANCPKENLVSHTQITTQPSTTLQPTAVWSSCDMNPNVTSDARLSAGFNRGDSLQENVDWHFNQASDDGTTMDAMYGLSNLGGMRLMPMNNLDGHDTGWMTEFGSMDNWDNGMPDVFAGATWESLLHVISQDNLTRGHHGA